MEDVISEVEFHGFGEEFRDAAVACGRELKQAVIQYVEGVEEEFDGGEE